MLNKWVISKDFDFCYGHRVWNQSLDPEFSIDNRCVCRHLHGHQGKIVVKLEASRLENGMVTDFKHLNWFKVFLDNTLDHKFIVDKSDPMFNRIIPHSYNVNHNIIKYPWIEKAEKYSIINPDYFKTENDDALVEILEGFVVVSFVPTSENLSRWLYEIIDKKMGAMAKVSSVQFFETPKSASYYGQ